MVQDRISFSEVVDVNCLGYGERSSWAAGVGAGLLPPRSEIIDLAAIQCSPVLIQSATYRCKIRENPFTKPLSGTYHCWVKLKICLHILPGFIYCSDDSMKLFFLFSLALFICMMPEICTKNSRTRSAGSGLDIYLFQP